MSVLDLLAPKGDPIDRWEKGSWVPSCWAEVQRPSDFRGISAPWTVVSKAGHTRTGPNDWPLTGIGQLVLLAGGVGTLCIWPADSGINTLGATIADSFHFLFKTMKWNEFLKWATPRVDYVTMEEGSAVWIPIRLLRRAGVEAQHRQRYQGARCAVW